MFDKDRGPDSLRSLTNGELRELVSSGHRDFAGANLRGRDLSCLDMTDASFCGSDLTGADLSMATLSFTDFQDACLDAASLHSAYLLDAKLAGASFRESMMEAAFLMSADASRCVFSKANLCYAFLAGANLSQAVLSNSDLTCANLSGAIFEDTALDAVLGATTLCRLDLSLTRSLSAAVHYSASDIDFGTLKNTAIGLARTGFRRQEIIEQFLADAGLTAAEIRYFRTLLPGASHDLSKVEFGLFTESDRVVARDPLAEFSVIWDSISTEEVREFEQVLSSATAEKEIQEYLQAHPRLLVQHFESGHGRWVIPQMRLGSEYIADFVIGTQDSLGFHWYLVELESPTERLFTRSGDPARMLRHAVRQVQDWRTWLQVNLGYARRAREDDGLGLTDIEPESRGLILIGRRKDIDPSTTQRRRRMARELRIDIHTYDYLLETAKARLSALGRG